MQCVIIWRLSAIILMMLRVRKCRTNDVIVKFSAFCIYCILIRHYNQLVSKENVEMHGEDDNAEVVEGCFFIEVYKAVFSFITTDHY